MKGKYGFYDRLKEEFPSQIIVDATEVCNLACTHCPHTKYSKENILEKVFLDVDLNNKMVDEVKGYGKENVQQIRYTANGEPLLHPKIFEMLRYSVKNSGVFVSITTNGTILDNNRIDELIDTGVNLIDISIDAFKEETYSKIRVKGDLKITRSNVLKLLKKKEELSSKTKIVVSFVEQRLNENESTEFRRFWEDMGVNHVIIRRLHSAGGANEDITNELNSKNSNRRPCVYPWERITLNAKGYLSYCPDCWDGKANIVDYRNATIYETWHSEFYKSLRDSNINNDFSNFQFCGKCPDWVQTRWPSEGRGYGDMIKDFSKHD